MGKGPLVKNSTWPDHGKSQGLSWGGRRGHGRKLWVDDTLLSRERMEEEEERGGRTEEGEE